MWANGQASSLALLTSSACLGSVRGLPLASPHEILGTGTPHLHLAPFPLSCFCHSREFPVLILWSRAWSSVSSVLPSCALLSLSGEV